MLSKSMFFLCSLFSVSFGAPVLLRAVPETFVLPVPTDGPGPTFDATATRAATSAQIRNLASPNICFDVSDFRAGDFRFNLVPLALKPCDTSIAGQKFDLITKGAHNNVADGSRTLIVSSQQFTCVDRRSNKNDRTRPGLFACGGRAAGDGGTTADQQYFFNKNASLSSGIGFPLVRDAVNNGVGIGNQCLTLNNDGFLSNTPCSPPNFTPGQTWIIGDSNAVASSVVTPSVITTSALLEVTKPAVSTSASVTLTTSAASTTSTSAPDVFVLPKPADGPGPTFDTTATRVATSSQIRNAGSPDTCFDVSNFKAGDFRFNLVPLALKKCDSSVLGQKFDLATKGEHNNVVDGSRIIIISSQQLTCIDRRSNINDRTRPGLFACGGRAAGDGETSADQQFFFNKTASLSGGIGFTLVRNAVNNGIGPGNTCMSLNKDGFVSNTPCSPPIFSPEQTWFIGDSAPAPLPPVTPPATTTINASTSSISSAAVLDQVTVCPAVVTSTVTTTVVVQTTTSTTAPVSQSNSANAKVQVTTTLTSASVSSTSVPETFVLPKSAEGPGPTFDATATRAATSVQIRNVGSSDTCFDVSNFRAGDFRFNLVPVALKKCDSSVAGQKFDLITKGQHNNVPDGSRTIIVSSQQLTCVDRRSNINDRTRPGLFACGGRAAGDGETTADQQYFFNKTANLKAGIGFPLVRDAVNNGIGPGNQCLTLNSDGFLSNTPCSPPNFTPGQTWIVG